jgi:hypothetical protein
LAGTETNNAITNKFSNRGTRADIGFNVNNTTMTVALCRMTFNSGTKDSTTHTYYFYFKALYIKE